MSESEYLEQLRKSCSFPNCGVSCIWDNYFPLCPLFKELVCSCGNKIEITVPMYLDGDTDEYICWDCFKKSKEECFIEKHLDIFERFAADEIKDFLKDLKAKKEYFTKHIWEMKSKPNFKVEIEQVLSDLIEKYEKKLTKMRGS